MIDPETIKLEDLKSRDMTKEELQAVLIKLIDIVNDNAKVSNAISNRVDSRTSWMDQRYG